MDWKLAPSVLVGEKVVWIGNASNKSQTGVVKWIGKIQEISSDWSVGIECDEILSSGGCDGTWMGRKLFECEPNRGLLVPMKKVQKYDRKPSLTKSNIESHSNLKLEDSQLRDFKHSNSRNKSIKESYEAPRKSRYFTLESKLTEWSLKNRKSDRRVISGFDFLNKNSGNQTNSFENVLHNFTERQHQLLKSKNKNGKSSLTRKKRKRKSLYKTDFERFSKAENEQRTKAQVLNETETFENAQTLVSKAYLKNMNDIAGYFKEIKEDDERYRKSDFEKSSDETSPFGMPDTTHNKEKKFFSFLKWFKKNKDDSNLKRIGESSAASSPMFLRRGTASCESIDTLFSTQTVRSFAYIPPTQYEPSAPPSSLMDLEKSSYENVFESQDKEKLKETEEINDRRKKRKAPEPPRLARENSLPSTLEHKKPEETENETKTFHRRTVSESFKDKKAGAYCHVQGKRKAPPPPPPQPSLYPNLQKLNNQYPSLYKKKKPAPPPPDLKSNFEQQNVEKQIGNNEKDGNPHSKNTQEVKSKMTGENPDGEDKETKSNQSPNPKLKKDVSLSPLPNRPWYKRSQKDSNGSNIIKKDLLKGFEKKKNKEIEEWMPEVGFPRRSLSTDSTHNKFNIFARLDKNEEKKKEEKRKSQISILTNISELDREAAEIVRKGQAEEKEKLAADEAKYYAPNIPIDYSGISSGKERDYKEKHKEPEVLIDSKDESKKKIPEKLEAPTYGEIQKDANRTPPTNQLVAENLTENNFKINNKPATTKTEDKVDKKNSSNSGNDLHVKNKPNIPISNVLKDGCNASNSISSNITSKPKQENLNYFKVDNKEVNYLNDPWVCKKCTLENPGWRVFCEICSSVKPRFLYNPTPKVNSNATQDNSDEIKAKQIDQKKPTTEKLSKEEEQKNSQEFKIEEPKPLSTKENVNDQKDEKQPEQILEGLKKKRMTFFTSKVDEDSPQKNKSGSPEKDNDKTKLKKILKEMKDSLPKPELEDQSADVEVQNNTANAAEKPEPMKETQNKIQPIRESKNEDVKYGAVKKKQMQPNKEEIAEAYMITKTIVLEDIIIKKGDKVPKVSSSVQTKSNHSDDPVLKSVKAPPRTKKMTLQTDPKPTTSKATAEGSPNSPATADTVDEFTQKDIEELTNRLTHAAGLADFRANIETMPLNTELNTVAVNRLLRKLETAINCGNQYEAAGLAKELALLKINCSVTRQSVSQPASNITISLHIEDKVSHQGPIPLRVSASMTLLQLKQKVNRELGIPIELQRWILGKVLATDDSKTLRANGITTDGCSVFLYLVTPEKKEKTLTSDQPDNNFKAKPSESNSPIKQIRQKPSPPKGPGWYYNYEEDHYSYCEESEDESREPSPKATKETLPTSLQSKKQTFMQSPQKEEQAEPPKETKKTERPSIFDLKTRDTENDIDKELKLIRVNSVKQKVEQINRTFAENNKANKFPPKYNQQEMQKCVACSFVNSSGNFICSVCNAKKQTSTPNQQRLSYPGKNQAAKKLKEITEDVNDDKFHYKELIELQDADLVSNAEPFNCSICMVDYSPGEGVTLKDCLHTFCRTCLISTVQFSEDAEVKCPYLDDTYSCTSVLQQREIKALVPKGIFERYLAKSVKEAENKMGNAFHCKTPDCKGWCIYEDNVNEFNCPVCKRINCLTCQAIHTGINCRQYQERMKEASETDVDAKKTREMLEEMVEKGEAMVCPKCQVVLMKKWGCDWLKCSMCKTEVCWVTRGFRWGPGGKGDTSGGCKCGVNGVKCHPKCNYCH